ncbi:hypothetical protein [Paludisphaera soli]|uniref:hypothetical protein n=1 Tax=Paludisphaera soli TaxID=2712865 RepID=UPI0013E9D0E4|nr:hypothetical protein [Paludisphaera soli]
MIGRELALYRMVSAEELKNLVSELGGRWHVGEGGCCQGVLDDAGALVWPYPPYPIDRFPCEPEHLAIIADHATSELVSVLEIGVSHNEGSQELASRVIEIMLGRWGGIEIDEEWFCTPEDADWLARWDEARLGL